MFEISVKRVHAPGENKTFETSKKRLKSSRGVFAYDSITVSSAWELTSKSMRYSQGEGVNTSLPRTMYCTHEWCSAVFGSVRLCSFLDPFLLCGYLPWHGHVLGTQVIKIMYGHQLYKQG